MPDEDLKRPFRGPSKRASTTFSDRERELIEVYARQEGLTFEEAVSELASEGLAARVRKRTGRRPSSNVRRFHR